MGNATKSLFSLVGGVGVGAIAMYLLDPDQGGQRRRAMAQRAEHVVSDTTGAVNTGLKSSAESAKSLAHNISQYSQQLADHASGRLSDTASAARGQARQAAQQLQERLKNSVGSLVNHAHRYAGDAADQVAAARANVHNRADAVYNRAKSAAQRQAGITPSHPVELAGEITLGTLAIAGIGAGAMYFFDPARGRARRSWAGDKISSWARKGGKSARRYGRHLGNQLKGYAHDAQVVVPPQWQPVQQQGTVGRANKEAGFAGASSSGI